MTNNVSRRTFIRRVGAAGAAGAATGTLLGASRTEAGEPGADRWREELSQPFVDPIHPNEIPDPQHLIRRDRGWKVLPNGVDDHDNLEWALRHTAPGGTVRLVSGTFKIGRPVVVADFDGTLAGAGATRTTLTCTDALSYEVWEAPGGGRDRGEPKPPPFPRIPVDGSAMRTAPVLIQFYKTPLRLGEPAAVRANRIVIRNFRCRGAMLGEPWAFGDEALSINIVNSLDWHDPGGRPATSRQDVLIAGMLVDGYRSAEMGPFENGCACITVLGGPVTTADYNLEGEVDGDALGIANGGLLDVTPAEGDVTFRSCTFRNCRLGPGVVGHRRSSILFEGNTTDGCRGSCLQVIDVGESTAVFRENDLRCDSFLLPPELANGAVDVPSSLGCIVAIQGLSASLGFPFNVQWAALAVDAAAHARHPEAGPLGTWRPQGPAAVPPLSAVEISDNACESSQTANTYCVHLADLANVAFGQSALRALVRENGCTDSQTCIGLDHVGEAQVSSNECASQAVGVELHDSPHAAVAGNSFDFPPGVEGCEVRILSLGDKIDLSRVVVGAGECVLQS